MELVLFGLVGFGLGFILCAGQIDKYVKLKCDQKAELCIDGKKYKVIEVNVVEGEQ